MTHAMMPRTVTEAGNDRSQPLAAFRDAGAFVLLGDLGAGKTSEFQREVEALGSDAVFLPARDFLALARDARDAVVRVRRSSLTDSTRSG